MDQFLATTISYQIVSIGVSTVFCPLERLNNVEGGSFSMKSAVEVILRYAFHTLDNSRTFVQEALAEFEDCSWICRYV